MLFSLQPVMAQTVDLTQLEGQWRFMASNNGAVGADGIYRAGIDTIPFTARLEQTSDGGVLRCHADNIYPRGSKAYPADWTMTVEQDAATGTVRLGFVLADDKSVSTEEFLEPASEYLEEGFFYFGVHSTRTDTGHRYLFLLSENIATHQLEAMTLWSGWMAPGLQTYSFPQNQQIYVVVSLDAAYSLTDHSLLGYIEIWASPKVEQIASGAAAIGVVTTAGGSSASEPCFDLMGRRASGQSHSRGLYIRQGHKVVK